MAKSNIDVTAAVREYGRQNLAGAYLELKAELTALRNVAKTALTLTDQTGGATDPAFGPRPEFVAAHKAACAALDEWEKVKP